MGASLISAAMATANTAQFKGLLARGLPGRWASGKLLHFARGVQRKQRRRGGGRGRRGRGRRVGHGKPEWCGRFSVCGTWYRCICRRCGEPHLTTKDESRDDRTLGVP